MPLQHLRRAAAAAAAAASASPASSSSSPSTSPHTHQPATPTTTPSSTAPKLIMTSANSSLHPAPSYLLLLFLLLLPTQSLPLHLPSIRTHHISHHHPLILPHNYTLSPNKA
ncbi:hypothetical protein SprV_0602194500 [Sparganum proliferum]